jgi:hypothetical protein
MAKRFTDTDKWKKPFLRGLEGPYKLLWMYILDDCDHAGIWHVDFEVARIRVGEKVEIDKALALFGERIHALEKSKWFIPDFIKFQYGELSEKNRAHLSVINVLKKHKVFTSPLQGAKDKEQDKDKDKDKDKEQDRLSDYEFWTAMILDGNDQHFEQMFMKEGIPPSDRVSELVHDHLALLHRYPKMRPADQQSFRYSCIKHIKENIGKANVKTSSPKLTLEDLKS